MLNRIARFIRQNELLDASATHLVALSGGADSVALLLVLRRLGYSVEAAHCNFHLRGEESDGDERFVGELCGRLGVALHVAHFDTRAYAEAHRVGIETAARELRYGYFGKLRRDVGDGRGEVCVAHHRDDAVETLLMNLLRGAGVHGLTGIRPRNGHVVRPMLDVSRDEIVDFLRAEGQDYVTDSTNLVADVVRNRVRLQVLPLLNDINPAASANIGRTARRMAEVERLWDEQVGAYLSAHFRDGSIGISDVERHPSPECLLHELLSPRGFTPSQVEQVAAGLRGPTGRRFESPTHEAAIDRGRLVVGERGGELPTMAVPEAGTYVYGGGGGRLRVEVSGLVRVSKSAAEATLDADKVGFPLAVRPVRRGDRFQPFGMSGSRLVSDYLTDRKRNVLEKRRQLVVTDAAGRIVWLVGERTDQRFCVDGTTKKVLCMSWSGEGLCKL